MQTPQQLHPEMPQDSWNKVLYSRQPSRTRQHGRVVP
jgi:hypothetical protein